MDRSQLVEKLKVELEEHLRTIGIDPNQAGALQHNVGKDSIRMMHSRQRDEVIYQEQKTLSPKLGRLIRHFADGREVYSDIIQPELVEVNSSDETGLLFRLATMLWSVPVSKGYGRRLRFLVRDRVNGKLIGVIGLKDPVFNLRIRDQAIGWTVRDREVRLVNVMDAFVVGAVPPYSKLLGGKLVASLIGSDEVASAFEKKYRGVSGIISGEIKLAKLALVTITSALGRSSIYNRLKLPGLVELRRIGVTDGWGHFHVPGPIFEDMRLLLEVDGHAYASGHRFGQGPNWRIRVIREALSRVGMNPDLLKHGIEREVFLMPLADNWQEFLQRKSDECLLDLPLATAIGEACVKRWMLPRSQRCPEYRMWTRDDTLELFHSIGL